MSPNCCTRSQRMPGAPSVHLEEHQLLLDSRTVDDLGHWSEEYQYQGHIWPGSDAAQGDEEEADFIDGIGAATVQAVGGSRTGAGGGRVGLEGDNPVLAADGARDGGYKTRHRDERHFERQVIQTPTHVGDLMVESASNDGDCTLGAPGIRWDLVQQLGDMHPRAFVALSRPSRIDIRSRAVKLDLMGSVDTASPPGHAMPTLDTLGWDRPELPLYLYLCS
ncbi:hypothetical protein B0H13DRAFT_2524446 [Mycena leptocephala]|nr:hypothetical protein B0H13DRAFT_2524446 [Mycena leptocephala]